MQSSNIIVMKSRTSNQNPEGVSAVWKAVHKLEDDLKAGLQELRDEINEPSFWSWVWTERNWAIPSMLVVLSGIAGGIWWIGGQVLDSHIRPALVPIQTDVKGMGETLQQIKAQVSDLQLRRAAEKADDLGSIKEAQTVLRSAQNSRVQLATDTIAETGKQFVDATKSNPDAWDAVVAFLNYRTYLNSLTVPMPPQLQNVAALTSYKIPAENGRIGVMKTSGVSKYPDVAQFRLITAPDLNAKLGVGPSYLLLESSDIKLDGLYVQRMIFINSHISYRGGPLSLDNVYFLNCTFDIDRQLNGQELAKKMLAGPITNFMVG